MESTFLDYLTLGNPHITVRSKGRGRSKTQRVYGPDKQREWKDMSYENLQSTFGAILSQPMDTPEVRNADEIPSEKTQVFTEKSVQKIAALWNEPVVQHALDGTYEILRAHPDMRFFEGRVQFTENDGRGNLVDEEGKQQRPDWMVYLTGNQGTVDNLIPGDCKLASKWKSEWLKEHNKTSWKKDAIWVLRQATKYMSLGNKRYSFILSEEELVPMRLPIYIRDKKADGNRTGNHHTNQMTIQTETFDVFDPEEDDDSFEPGSNIPRLSIENDPDGSFADASRDTGYILE
ncbi:hypothetical protein SAMD00023353_1500660 [Rosellinia necatrix]|uniref:Uncharacterized protein n=1 Tax=Rosellinia necatrix TaxID=77044 RepID=A0A1W2TIZ5_ROSNE|nr:hypothetical protein SAMD00023353_1500660 [Rosellinia necatrix]